VLVSGCSMVEVYYKFSQSSARALIESEPKQEQQRISDKNNETLNLMMSFEVSIYPISTTEKFQVRLLTKFNLTDTKVLKGSIFAESSEELQRLGQNKIKVLSYCDYFNEKNWNCGDRELYRNEIMMKDGQLYVGAFPLKRHYRLRFENNLINFN
jgi:hypothetical protein